MTWWDRFMGVGAGRGRVSNSSALSPEIVARIAAWKTLPASDPHLSVVEARVVVADVETTGLDVTKDRLVAIGAVAVVAGAVRMSESFEVTLQQATPSSVENILVHRIPTGEQLRGIPPAEALMAFLEFVGRAPLVGFHALFDEIMLARAYEQHLGEKIAQRWIDLRELAPALGIRPPGSRHAAHPPSLDESLAEFGVAISRRHQAVADAFGTAQLFQALSQRAASQGYRSIDGLRTLIDDAKWSHR